MCHGFKSHIKCSHCATVKILGPVSKHCVVANFAQFPFKVTCLHLWHDWQDGWNRVMDSYWILLTYQLCEFWGPNVFYTQLITVRYFNLQYFVQAQASHVSVSVSVWLNMCVSMCLCYLSRCVFVWVCMGVCVFVYTHVCVCSLWSPPQILL